MWQWAKKWASVQKFEKAQEVRHTMFWKWAKINGKNNRFTYMQKHTKTHSNPSYKYYTVTIITNNTFQYFHYDFCKVSFAIIFIKVLQNFHNYENFDFFRFGFGFCNSDWPKTCKTKTTGNETVLHCPTKHKMCRNLEKVCQSLRNYAVY